MSPDLLPYLGLYCSVQRNVVLTDRDTEGGRSLLTTLAAKDANTCHPPVQSTLSSLT